jgi:hypothetical protein
MIDLYMIKCLPSGVYVTLVAFLVYFFCEFFIQCLQSQCAYFQ